MARYDNIEPAGEEFFLRPIDNEQPKATPAPTVHFTPSVQAVPAARPTSAPAQKHIKLEKNMGFEASVNSFSYKDAVKGKKKKKRRMDANTIIRLVAVCICVGIFAFSAVKIGTRFADLNEAKKEYASLNSMGSNSVVSHPGPVRRVSSSLDLLTYLGSDGGGIDHLDTETINYYDQLREKVLNTKAQYPNCIGWIMVSGTNIDYPLMKTYNNDYYLNHKFNNKVSNAGAIFADYRLSNDFDKNMNTVIYGHCMTNGEMFRGIKLFFDSEHRYSKAQELEITIVTEDGVYIYEYFSGYRSEGSHFISRYIDNGTNKNYYSFLKKIRAKNSIPKNVGYNGNSKIVTLVTCTNLSYKPDERYVLHGILKKHFTFE